MIKFFIETYGCALNTSDSEKMAGILEENGFIQTFNIEDSNVIILNSCTVKTPTENKIYKRLREIEKLKIPIILAGCLAQTEVDIEKLKNYSLIGTHQIDNIVEIVEEAIHNSKITLIAEGSINRLELKSKSKSDLISIIPICHGCLGDCSYCKVKFARGKLKSFSEEQILLNVQNAINDGFKEIWLTAQDVGAYGLDINTNLPSLLNKILNLEGSFKIRLGMGNPNHIIKFLPELIECFTNKKLFSFLHIPLQSANNQVLKRMNRKYNVDDFKKIVNDFRERIRNITIATDIICGFPEESKEQFDDTLNLIKDLKIEIVNISRFWPRSGTKASKLKGYNGSIAKKRSGELSKLYVPQAFEENKKWIGWKGNIFINEVGKFNSLIGRNQSYRQVIINSSSELLGKIVSVRVFDVSSYDLRAKRI
jgi:threonylcarbamoyladenosine tRNA methylthiotransferase CDKAL1